MIKTFIRFALIMVFVVFSGTIEGDSSEKINKAKEIVDNLTKGNYSDSVKLFDKTFQLGGLNGKES